MKTRIVVLIVIATAVLGFSTGCQRLEERFTPPPTVVTEEATRAASGAPMEGELSAETPADLPVWPGATVTESKMTDDAYSLTLQTADPYEDVLNGLVAGFETAGWQVAREEAGESESMAAILTVSNDANEGIVTLTQIEDGSTQIDYVVAPSAQ